MVCDNYALWERNRAWRYDPIFISEKYTLQKHIEDFEKMAANLSGYTNTCEHFCRYCYANYDAKQEIWKDMQIRLAFDKG